MELYRLAADHRQLIQHFNRDEYPAYYQEYRAKVASAMESITDIPASVNRLAEGLARDWKAAKLWNRSALRDGDRMLLCTFLIPALLDLNDAKAQEAAETAQRVLKERFSFDIQLGSYENIMKGFEPKLFGIRVVKPEHVKPGEKRFCTKCGKELATGGQFCPHCGNKLPADSQAE